MGHPVYEVYGRFLQDAPDGITVVAERRNCSGCNKLYSGGQGAIQFDVTVPSKSVIWGANLVLDCENTFFPYSAQVSLRQQIEILHRDRLKSILVLRGTA